MNFKKLLFVGLTLLFTGGAAVMKCSQVQFRESQISDGVSSLPRKVYVSTHAVPMTWFDAVCCCRSRNQYLASIGSRQESSNLFKAIGLHNFGWVDTNAYAGTWTNLATGATPPDIMFYRRNVVPLNGTCMEVAEVPEVFPEEYMFGYQQSCDTEFSEELICEERNTKDVCFIGGRGCNKENVINYASTASSTCPEAGRTITSTSTKPSTSTGPSPTEETRYCCGCSSFWSSLFPNSGCPWWSRYMR